MTDYLIRIEAPSDGPGPRVLFETVVSGLDSARDAAGIAIARSLLRLEEIPENAWIEAYELPDRVIRLRVPARSTHHM